MGFSSKVTSKRTQRQRVLWLVVVAMLIGVGHPFASDAEFAGLTSQVEHPEGISVTHYRARGHSDQPQFLLWFHENLPDIPILVNDLPFVRSVALLVGISTYKHLQPLVSVKNDVDQMLKWLLLEEQFDDVYVLRD